MHIKKVVDTKDKKYPKKVTFDTGLTVKIPQQRQFGTFSKSHGCSMAAVNLALQLHGINKSLDDIHVWCKKNLPNYTGSKLTIFGCETAINKLVGKKVATWHPITGTKANRNKAIKNIVGCIKKGGFVLVEQRSPIHTNVLIATRVGGTWCATNGVLKKVNIPKIVKDALIGYKTRTSQRYWYKGGESKKAAGYVLINKK